MPDRDPSRSQASLFPAGQAAAPAPDPKLVQAAQEVLALAEALARGLADLDLAMAQAAGLRPPAFALLSVLAQAGDPGATVSEAALKLDVRPQALSGVVADLVREGLLGREVDQSDGRARRLSLTAAGRARFAQAQEHRQRLVQELLAQVPQPSVAKLVLTRLGQALHATLAGAGGPPPRPAGSITGQDG